MTYLDCSFVFSQFECLVAGAEACAREQQFMVEEVLLTFAGASGELGMSVAGSREYPSRFGDPFFLSGDLADLVCSAGGRL